MDRYSKNVQRRKEYYSRGVTIQSGIGGMMNFISNENGAKYEGFGKLPYIKRLSFAAQKSL